MGRLISPLICLLAVAGSLQAQNDDAARRIARELAPAVERAVGLKFRREPVVAVRSREQVRQFLNRRIAEQFPTAEIRAVERAYKAFGLIPDTLDLRRLLLDLYAEQVAGFYDPDSSALFIVRGADPTMIRMVMAHELVHALQDQYMSLSRIMKLRRQNDRQTAAQAVTEGQAVFASMGALMPGQDMPDLSQAWSAVREGIRQQQSAMPVFASAPQIVQEGMLFPYLGGAEFVRTFNQRRSQPDEQPYGERMPVSTEEVLHPSRYTANDRPMRIGFAPAGHDTLVYDDDFGEFETRIALETWGASEAQAIAAAAGWNGDRYEVLGSAGGTVVVWALAWDTPGDATEFAQALRQAWERARGRGAAGRRWQVDSLVVSGTSVVRLVDAPSAWQGWSRLPAPRLTRLAR